jgi:CheY-like chemotaxis protein
MLSGGRWGEVGVPRILLVDDDPNLLVLLAGQLRADGFDVQTARDGDEALRRLRSGWPDLLIVDMMMPRMDGLSLAREIKGMADLPIIVLSAIDTADPRRTSWSGRGLRHQAVPLPELGHDPPRVAARRQVPRRESSWPQLSLELRHRTATFGARSSSPPSRACSTRWQRTSATP